MKILLYTKFSSILKHPIKYIKWRIKAEKVWKQSIKSQYITFDWFLKEKVKWK